MNVERASMPDVAGVAHRWVDVGGLRVHVAEAGSGPPLLLLHGWPQHWFCWRRVVPLLAPQFRLIMPDLRGHGWTDAPRRGYAKEQLADDLLGLLDELQLDQVGLIGHDWGGWVSFLACLRAPERFAALLALGITHPFQRPTLAKSVQAWRGAYQVALSVPVLAQATLQSNPWLVGAAIRSATVDRQAVSADDARVYGDVLRERDRAHASVQMYRTFLLHEVPRLSRYQDQRLELPVHLMIGDRDPIYSPALLDGWQDHAEQMTVEVVAGVGHFLPEEIPSDVAAAANALFAGDRV
jgi:pimeloyl-ACP methyl ester carboxylesterase